MPLPDHQLLVISGMIGSYDVWSTSLKTVYGTGTVLSLAQQQDLLTTTQIPKPDAPGEFYLGLSSLVQAWWKAELASPSSTSFANVFSLTSIKFNSIGPDGKYVYQSTSEVEVQPPISGKATQSGISPRQTLAVTMRASFDRGPGAYGRMFWPGSADTFTESGKVYVSPADATKTLNTALALIRTINGAEIDGQNLAVANVSQLRDGTPVRAAVTRLEVDRVVDTQRRRTNRVPRNTVTADV